MPQDFWRNRSLSPKQLRRAVAGERLEADEEQLRAELDQLRPRTRADCENGPRPCPWVSCKHHLYLDVNPGTGSIKLNFPDLEPWELQHTCALDRADDGAGEGGLTLEEVGDALNVTRERIRQMEEQALARAGGKAALL
jgi:hypothetical protein